MNEEAIEIAKAMTLRDLVGNIVHDEQEDADTGFSWDLTIEEYLENLTNY